MSIVWHCDRDGCEVEYRDIRGSRGINSKSLRVGSGDRMYEFCSYDCLVIFIVKEGYLLK